MWNSAVFAALSSPLTSCGYTTASGVSNLDQSKPDITGQIKVSFLTKPAWIPFIPDFTITSEKDFQAAEAGCTVDFEYLAFLSCSGTCCLYSQMRTFSKFRF